MENNEIIDQSQLAEDLNTKIKYEFKDMFLVKPLELTKVKKEFSTPVAKEDKPVEDANNIEAIDYEDVATEIKEVDSDYRTGIVLKIPFSYTNAMQDEKYPALPIQIGDTIVFKAVSGRWFDLLKDSQLVSQYDVLGVEK